MPNDLQLIVNALSKHFIFSNLKKSDLKQIIDKMLYFVIRKNEIIVRQGASATNFFILSQGELQVIINDKHKKKIHPGGTFGELALLHNTKRTATIRTIKDSALWGLDRNTFRKAVESINSANYIENKAFLESVPIFQSLTH